MKWIDNALLSQSDWKDKIMHRHLNTDSISYSLLGLGQITYLCFKVYICKKKIIIITYHVILKGSNENKFNKMHSQMFLGHHRLSLSKDLRHESSREMA